MPDDPASSTTTSSSTSSTSSVPARPSGAADDRTSALDALAAFDEMVDPSVATVREPLPADHDDAPHAVLDELRQAFTGTPPGGAAPPAVAGIDLDDLPPAAFDDFSVHSADDDLPPAEPWVVAPPEPFGGDAPARPVDAPAGPEVPAALGEFATGDVRIVRRRPGDTVGGGAAPPAVPAEPVTPAAAPAATASPAAGSAARHEAPRADRTTIVIGGDDELPDPVYLDDGDGDPTAVESTGGQTFVIGDELEASGAFDAVQVPSRSMDPRVRARRIAVKRAQSRKRLLWVAGVAGVVIVVVAVLAVFASGLFAVSRVDVQGAPYTTARYGDRLDAIVDEMMGEPVLLVDTRAAEEALEQLPWIERAFVRTDFPDRVLVDVRERQPLATFAGSDGRYRVIDRDGDVLDVLDGQPSSYLLIAGPGPDLEPGSTAGAPYAAAAQLVGALPAELRELTTAVSVDPTTADLGLTLQFVPTSDPGDPSTSTATSEPASVSVRIGSFNGLDGKLARLLQLVREGLDDASPIDVSTDDVIG